MALLLFHLDDTGLSIVGPYLALLCIFGGFQWPGSLDLKPASTHVLGEGLWQPGVEPGEAAFWCLRRMFGMMG